jgi:hypothetical protein
MTEIVVCFMRGRPAPVIVLGGYRLQVDAIAQQQRGGAAASG